MNLLLRRFDNFFAEVITYAELVEITESALQLRQAYIDYGVVTQKSMLDALHVALASVAGCTMIVSWNFKHIVHFQKIPLYRAINVIKGYSQLDIYSPLEVINYEG